MMKNRRQLLGQEGEALARELLEQKGYRIVERNARTRRGEIDLIAMDGTVLVFVEVRTRSSHTFGTALESITWRKRQKLRELAMEYLQTTGGFVPAFRFDVIAIDCSNQGALKEQPQIQHIEQAF